MKPYIGCYSVVSFTVLYPLTTMGSAKFEPHQRSQETVHSSFIHKSLLKIAFSSKDMGVDAHILKFYGRRNIQAEIVNLAKNREVAVKFGEKGYGRRPDVLQYESDVKELAQEGATSFHLSEEHWHDPLKLKTGMVRKDLDELRSGWDLILDIDCKFIEFSKITAQLLIEALHFHNIHSIGLKFSGNRGFHIVLPFNTFPPVVNGKNIILLFVASWCRTKEVIHFADREQCALDYSVTLQCDDKFAVRELCPF